MLATSIYRVSIRGNGFPTERTRRLGYYGRLWRIYFCSLSRVSRKCVPVDWKHSSINVSGTYHRFFKFLFEINIVISKRVEGILRPCLSLISTIFISKADRRGFDTHDEGLKEERIRGEKWIVANW